MKKKILVLVLVVATLVGCVCAFTACDKGDGGITLTMYTEAGFAPYEFVGSDGKVTGVDVAIASQVAEDLGMKLEIKDVLFDNIPQFVKEAKGNAIGAAGMTITADRKEAVDFSDVYASSTLVIVSKTGISKLSDLAGKKVGVQEGTSGDLILEKANSATGHNGEGVTIKNLGATPTQVKQYALLKTYLTKGTIDAILMDKLPAESLFFKDTTVEKVPATDLVQEDFGVAVKKGNTKIMEAVNAVIKKWLADGTLAKYTEYYTALDAFEQGKGAKPEANGLKLSWNC